VAQKTRLLPQGGASGAIATIKLIKEIIAAIIAMPTADCSVAELEDIHIKVNKSRSI
jgi:hypothetical protein